MMVSFKILHQQGQARLGKLTTPHGVIETPNFIPVGTQGAVKALGPRELREIKVQAVLANTYHLMLRPGDKLIKKMGGLHKFMNWLGPLMTDSGGFQVFSLGVALEHGVGKLLREQGGSEQPKPRLNRITEEGVEFQSHLDGSKHILTPEKSMQIQANLGSDLTVSFDDLESPKYSYAETLKSLELTEKWGLRSKKAFYGVTHGGVFKDLRVRSAKFVDKNFLGIALGGAHKNKKTLCQVIDWTLGSVDPQKPRHLLGIGEPQDLWEGAKRGVDLFDCAAPTRRARRGSLYISPQSGLSKNFAINISSAKFTNDKNPVDPTCSCYVCQNFSRAYLRYLYQAGEILYHQLATYHNVYFINNLMKKIRESIKNKKFSRLKNGWR
ncbi:tRNA guanosine(34) transglycosylase Tgt [Candidatus Daviesbacteria bacterium]|nr:tRNA guanosine(34) transglycosylase Tgt [Candidatus Daviesbacteria bacterium]